MCHHERDGVRGFGVAQATKNCDLLCVPESADRLLDLLCEKNFAGVLPRYRGHLSPPLDQRWLRGGWTSHFVWKTGDAEAYLDVFGPAPRASSPWEAELHGLYAGPHTVAEMKRTDRGKDWPFATALGVKLLEAGDPRGWLHLFDYEVLIQMVERVPCPAGLIAQRPVLGLLVARDERLEVALKAEIEFWQRLDHLRLRVYERAVRSYMLAVKKDDRADAPDLRTQHRARVEPAEPAAVESAARPRRGPTGDRSPRGGRPIRARRLTGVVARCAQLLYRFGVMNVPPRKPDWLTPKVRKHLKRLEYDFQVRAFGEEMARVNFLPRAQRRRYIADMMDHALRKGVKFEKPARGVTP